MLMDEPFGALDPLVRKDIRNWLRGLHTRLGLTSIFITHDQGEAVELADRVAVMRGGRILQIGTPDELEARPSVPFVFEFLGPTIRLEGDIRSGAFHASDLAVQPFYGAGPDGPAVALLRQHQLGLIANGGEATVVSVRKAGPLVHYAVECRGRTIELISTEAALPPGSSVSLVMSHATIFPQPASASTDRIPALL